MSARVRAGEARETRETRAFGRFFGRAPPASVTHTRRARCAPRGRGPTDRGGRGRCRLCRAARGGATGITRPDPARPLSPAEPGAGLCLVRADVPSDRRAFLAWSASLAGETVSVSPARERDMAHRSFCGGAGAGGGPVGLSSLSLCHARGGETRPAVRGRSRAFSVARHRRRATNEAAGFRRGRKGDRNAACYSAAWLATAPRFRSAKDPYARCLNCRGKSVSGACFCRGIFTRFSAARWPFPLFCKGKCVCSRDSPCVSRVLLSHIFK